MTGYRMVSSFHLLFWLTQAVNFSVLVILSVWLISYDGGLGWSPNYRQQFNWHKLALTLGLVNITALGVYSFLLMDSFKNKYSR